MAWDLRRRRSPVGWGVGLAGVLALIALAIPARGEAATWTELASGTTEDITAVEYQSPDRFWFTTSNGKIYRRVGGVFQLEHNAPGVVFNDIEFQSGAGSVGLAVGNGGAVFRSTDGGESWAPVLGIAGGDNTDPNVCTTAEPLGDADSVNFASATDVWMTAAGSQIFWSGNAGASWINQNDAGATCRISEDIDDAFPVPGSSTVYFVSKDFGSVFLTSNNLTTPAAARPASAGNGFTGATRRVAGDPANPNRQWAVFPSGGGLSYPARTSDGWNDSSAFTLGEEGDVPPLYDIDYAGGTVVAVGSAGALMNSTDGASFFFDTAPGALATQEWISVSLASATSAAAGGRNGALVLSDNANVTVDGGSGLDTTPPETAITKKPKKKVKSKKKKKKVTFEFISNEPGSTFACAFDGKPAKPCTPPLKQKVKTGKRKFSVVATDAAGNADPTPANYSFKVKRKKRR